MLIQIPELLPPVSLEAMREVIDPADLFEAGSRTAGWHAVAHKNNLQARPGSQADLSRGGLVKGVAAKVQEALWDNRVFQSAARPRQLLRLTVSRYEQGMSYGPHVDDAIMDGGRADLSFTLFLSAPGDYRGGELVIDSPDGEHAFREAAGTLLLYPSTTLHRVEPVTQGRRLVIVGWVQSHVRAADQREILFDLDRSIEALRSIAGTEAAMTGLLKTRSNLLRRWAEV